MTLLHCLWLYNSDYTQQPRVVTFWQSCVAKRTHAAFSPQLGTISAKIRAFLAVFMPGRHNFNARGQGRQPVVRRRRFRKFEGNKIALHLFGAAIPIDFLPSGDIDMESSPSNCLPSHDGLRRDSGATRSKESAIANAPFAERVRFGTGVARAAQPLRCRLCRGLLPIGIGGEDWNGHTGLA